MAARGVQLSRRPWHPPAKLACDAADGAALDQRLRGSADGQLIELRARGRSLFEKQLRPVAPPQPGTQPDEQQHSNRNRQVDLPVARGGWRRRSDRLWIGRCCRRIDRSQLLGLSPRGRGRRRLVACAREVDDGHRQSQREDGGDNPAPPASRRPDGLRDVRWRRCRGIGLPGSDGPAHARKCRGKASCSCGVEQTMGPSSRANRSRSSNRVPAATSASTRSRAAMWWRGSILKPAGPLRLQELERARRGRPRRDYGLAGRAFSHWRKIPSAWARSSSFFARALMVAGRWGRHRWFAGTDLALRSGWSSMAFSQCSSSAVDGGLRSSAPVGAASRSPPGPSRATAAPVSARAPGGPRRRP